MDKIQVIVELSGGEIQAVHGSEDIDLYIINWDEQDDLRNEWEQKVRTPHGVDAMIDKHLGNYLNELINA